MKLARLGVAFYRSIGEEAALVDLRKRATIVIGANNSGKSNILVALQLLKERKGLLTAISPIDRHLRDDRNAPRVVVDAEIQAGDDFPNRAEGELVRFIREFSGTEPCWIENPFSTMDLSRFNTNDFSSFNAYFQRQKNSRFRGMPDPKVLANIISEISRDLCAPLLDSIPKVVFIPQHRQITAASKYDIHGAGIVDLLASWQHPEIGADQNSDNFRKVQTLLRDLLHLPSIEIEVPHDKSTVVVKREGLRLPLNSYGTGIHQLIVLAVAVLSYQEALICIEEPEVNLHPTLQREFLRFLLSSTTNNYVISTHSQSLIDPGADVDVLHVSLQGQVTVPRLVQTPQDSLNILRDLGVRASDLLQANAVVWVEGPSDRIYLNRWLALLAPNLVEGIHYSVMFYGGKLLSHVTMDREAITVAHDLVRLMRINQHSAIEIENYLSPEAIGAAYSELTGIRPLTLSFGSHDSLETQLKAALSREWRPKYSYDQAKPLRAREIAAKVEAKHIDPKLKRHLNAIIKMIRGASELYHGEASRQIRDGENFGRAGELGSR